jgi:hypothetical protein
MNLSACYFSEMGWAVFLKHAYYKNVNEPSVQARKNENRQSPFP